MKKPLKKEVHQYIAIFEPDQEAGGYTVTIPALAGCISEGDSFEQALENITEAASLYLEVMTSRGERIKEQGDGVVVAPVRVTV